ncbi:hypothetical protein [Stenotrophomonas maltophilia]|uniref:hypothetical protein n=1 Tax=Stenotrophomonas maltophilia TaxID=40324 RepID=UPI003BF8B99D
MNYYLLGINENSRKWKGCLNIDPFLLNECHEEIHPVDLVERWGCIRGQLFYRILADGAASPVTSIGSQFLAFAADIVSVENLQCPDVQFLPLTSLDGRKTYLMMRVLVEVDCIDWQLSTVDPWPAEHVCESWQSEHGRFFIKPIARKDKIPSGADVFFLGGWKDAFNIVVSERFKAEVLSLDFDHDFLSFELLGLV